MSNYIGLDRYKGLENGILNSPGGREEKTNTTPNSKLVLMDFFFQQDLQVEMLWPEIPEIHTPPPPPPPRSSAFAPYAGPGNGFPTAKNSNSPSSHHRNLNKRMIEILGALRKAAVVDREPLSGYRHMIKERQRRNKMRQNYEDLHAQLPPGTKADKNSIVQKAVSHALELQGLLAQLQSKNRELEARLARKAEKAELAKINLKVMYPSSAMDSMVEVLKCLRDMKVKAKAIKWELSAEEFSAMLEIENKLHIAEVERAVKSTLTEVERKVSFHFAEAPENEAVEIWDFWEGQVA